MFTVDGGGEQPQLQAEPEGRQRKGREGACVQGCWGGVWESDRGGVMGVKT